MNITSHAAAAQISEKGQSERVAHGIDVKVWDKFCQRLPSQEDGAHTLSKQSEVRKQAGLHKQPVTQEHKLNWPRQHNVETALCSMQNLLACHTQVPRVDYEVNVCIPINIKIA